VTGPIANKLSNVTLNPAVQRYLHNQVLTGANANAPLAGLLTRRTALQAQNQSPLFRQEDQQ
jgi:hypothetical protein